MSKILISFFNLFEYKKSSINFIIISDETNKKESNAPLSSFILLTLGIKDKKLHFENRFFDLNSLVTSLFS